MNLLHAAMGIGTEAGEMLDAFKRKIFYGKHNINDLMDLLKKNRKEKFLLPCSDVTKQEIIGTLKDHDINFTRATIYKTVCSNLADLDVANYDMIVFFSPSGVTSLHKNFPKASSSSSTSKTSSAPAAISAWHRP